MGIMRQTESSGGATPPQSTDCRASQRLFHWFWLGTLALALAALATPEAQAGVEFVTRTGDCRSFGVGGGGISIMAGPNVRFRVFGDFVDVDASSKFRIATDSGAGSVTARIVSKGNTSDCAGGLKGWAVVEVDSPVDLTSNIKRSLYFKMPLGDESRLQMTIKAYPTFNVDWKFSPLPSCIVKIGTFEIFNQDKNLRIQLPPGHRQDQTNCNETTLHARVTQSSIGDVMATEFKYSASGLPTFLTSSTNLTLPWTLTGFTFTIDVARIRALTAVSNSTITVRSPNPNRTSTVNLEVRPELANGFTTSPVCNPSALTAGNLTDCTLKLAFAPSGSAYPITWRMTTANCFAQAVAEAPYVAGSVFQHFQFPVGQTSANIRLRSVNNAGCAAFPTPITHTFEAWIGDSRINPQVTTVTSGPTYTRATISLKSSPPQQ